MTDGRGAGRLGDPPWASAAVLAVYAVGLAAWPDAVPDGLNNDAAEEALRGLHLLEAGQLRLFSSTPGIPQETLYLYIVAAAAALFGTTTFAIHLVGGLAALACVWLIAAAARRVEPATPRWLALAVAASSLWLFHYGRAGVRAISAPLFCLAVALLLERAERRPAERAPAWVCGAALALSLYTYTACRALVAAFLLYAALRLWRAGEARRGLTRCYGHVLVAAAVVSIPNLTYLLAAPSEYLWRGSYVVRGGATSAGAHLLASALLPFWYPERYWALAGPTHLFDGVSAGLASAGIRPLDPLLAGALLIGLVPLWRRRATPVAAYLAAVWLMATLLLGFTGPSLTRLLVALPVFLVVAVLGFGALLSLQPRWAPYIAVALALQVASAAYQYLALFPRADQAQAYFSPAATPIGQRARALAAGGLRVVAVVAKDANVVRYLTHDRANAATVIEFYQRPPDPAEIPLATPRPDVLLIERAPGFSILSAAFPPAQHVGSHPRYDEIALR